VVFEARVTRNTNGKAMADGGSAVFIVGFELRPTRKS